MTLQKNSQTKPEEKKIRWMSLNYSWWLLVWVYVPLPLYFPSFTTCFGSFHMETFSFIVLNLEKTIISCPNLESKLFCKRGFGDRCETGNDGTNRTLQIKYSQMLLISLRMDLWANKLLAPFSSLFLVPNSRETQLATSLVGEEPDISKQETGNTSNERRCSISAGCRFFF